MADDFFALGGHSLLAVAMMGGIREAFGVDLPLRTLFNEPTPAGLLAAVHRQTGAVDSTPGTSEMAEGADGRSTAAGRTSLADWLRAGFRPARPPRLSPAQSRMWFLNQLDPALADYNISLAVRLTGGLDEAALDAAVRALVGRHEVLRTVYPETGGVAEQRVLAPDGPTAAAMGLDVGDAGSDAEVEALLAAEAARGFDVRSDIPLRARLIRLPSDGGQDQWVLHLVMHHIASDGASLAPLAQDLSARPTPQHSSTRLPLQYADFSTWQRRQLAGPALEAKVAHWQQALAGIPAELMLPADHRRPREPRQPGGQLGFQVDLRKR